ncbi:MAG TPA: RHS repeat-associated core domain-containing protein [Usitatibacter sp.]|jgi:RHS repeat-associated protein|nr:RHS repeat-associated core domain-containing protein [Usitatibacter sp.]
MRCLWRFCILLGLLVGLEASASTTTYFHNDLTGSPLAATDSSGHVLWRESYRPYGERLVNSASAKGNDVWFTSRRQDIETGLVYMGARYYDPVAGRFASIDPKGFDEATAQSFNRYAYANDNPGRYSDPDGRWAQLIVWAARATGAGYAAGVLADAASQLASLGSVDWSIAMTSSAARAGAESGLFSLAPGPSLGLTVRSVEEAAIAEGRASAYIDSTEGRSVPNRTTNISRDDFEKNLTEAGWEKSVSKDGQAAVFQKDGAKYSLRDFSNEGSKTAEYTKFGNRKPDLKIRLGE